MPARLREPGRSAASRAPIIALLVAGRQRLRPTRGDDIEIEERRRFWILRGVDEAHADTDAEPLKRLLVGQHIALEGWVEAEELDSEGLAGLGIDELAAALLVARLLEEVEGAAQVGALRLRIAVDRVSDRAS